VRTGYRCAVTRDPSAPAKAAIEGFHHVAVVVRDAEAARAFYGELLGLEEIERPADLAGRIPGAWFRLGTGELHIFEQRDYEVRAAGPIGPHFALHTGDFEATVDLLQRRGVEFAFGPMRDGEGVGRLILRDPTGNIVEITDARPGSSS
jgi:glyoxylase I family protein